MNWFRNCQRLLAIFTVGVLLVSQTANASYEAGSLLWQSIQQYRQYPGHFTQRPVRPNLGPNPRREPVRRALWSSAQLEVADRQGFELLTSIFPFAMPPGGHTTAVGSASGGSYGWEGSTSSSGKSGGSISSAVNTANGNKLTRVNLLQWEARGGMKVDFTLFHNSQSSYNDELGHGWTWTYDIYINDDDVNNPVVHWGDGLAVPYSYSGTLPSGVDFDYTQGAGIYDKLTKKADGTWLVTTHGQTKYEFNADGFCTKIKDRTATRLRSP